jgi:hypothetical protein
MKTVFAEQTAGTAKRSAPSSATAAGVALAEATRFSCVSPSAALAAKDTRPIVPEFCRLPKPGQLCPWTGLSRSKMNELILPCPANDWKPPVKSISLRKKGSVRGCRLIVYDSLIFYLKTKLNESNENE